MKHNFFIDESCHLEHDGFSAMCIGCIKVPENMQERYKADIKNIKLKYGIKREFKWNTVSMAQYDLYKELIDYFFASEMEFRCVLVTYKDRLDHTSFNNGSHDNFYYKMIYYALYNPYKDYSQENDCRVFLDIKDTRGREKLDKIQQVFDNKFHGHSPFTYFQHIRSHESQFIQLTDLLIGAVCYKARGMETKPDASEAKIKLIEYLEQKSGYVLNEGTEPSESKFNIFNHQPRRQ